MKLLLLVPFVLLTACTQPFITIPGGKLTGETKPAPATWTSVPEVVQFETRPSDPYSINIWALVDNSHLYLATRTARWLGHIEADDRVRVKVEDAVYDLRAVKVTDEAELQRLVLAYEKKYDVDPDEGWVNNGVAAFRLEQR